MTMGTSSSDRTWTVESFDHQEIELSQELRRLRHELNLQFDRKSWNALSQQLEQLIQIGEGHGKLELCLRAQSLRQRMSRSSGNFSEDNLATLFEDLMFYLSHLEWSAQSGLVSSSKMV